MRYFLILVLFVSCNGSSGGPSGVGALYENSTEQIVDPNESEPDCQILIDVYEAELEDLRNEIDDLKDQIEMLNNEIDDREYY